MEIEKKNQHLANTKAINVANKNHHWIVKLVGKLGKDVMKNRIVA